MQTYNLGQLLMLFIIYVSWLVTSILNLMESVEQSWSETMSRIKKYQNNPSSKSIFRMDIDDHHDKDHHNNHNIHNHQPPSNPSHNLILTRKLHTLNVHSERQSNQSSSQIVNSVQSNTHFQIQQNNYYDDDYDDPYKTISYTLTLQIVLNNFLLPYYLFSSHIQNVFIVTFQQQFNLFLQQLLIYFFIVYLLFVKIYYQEDNLQNILVSSIIVASINLTLILPQFIIMSSINFNKFKMEFYRKQYISKTYQKIYSKKYVLYSDKFQKLKKIKYLIIFLITLVSIASLYLLFSSQENNIFWQIFGLSILIDFLLIRLIFCLIFAIFFKRMCLNKFRSLKEFNKVLERCREVEKLQTQLQLHFPEKVKKKLDNNLMKNSKVINEIEEDNELEDNSNNNNHNKINKIFNNSDDKNKQAALFLQSSDKKNKQIEVEEVQLTPNQIIQLNLQKTMSQKSNTSFQNNNTQQKQVQILKNQNIQNSIELNQSSLFDNNQSNQQINRNRISKQDSFEEIIQRKNKI